ncbi:NAD-glutamate dehydrogenase, partial [Streptococcus pneumoniae]|nr:NAD-glutamate dehydrogenase [Streptococcus pneumoniae]
EPRRPGEPANLRIRDVTVTREGRPRDLSVVEVVNDNRPFLLDSCLAELSVQGLAPLLVAHPILGVERGADRRLGRVVGETT